MKFVSKVIVAVSLIVFLSGCASYRGGQVGEITDWPPASPPEKKSISYVITGKTNINGTVNDALPAAIDAWKVQLEKAYNDSGMFFSVFDGVINSDIRAEVSITNAGEANFVLAFLSGFTFGVIPSYANDEFIVETTFRDSNGNVLGRVDKKEDVSTWIQILLLPITPFAFPVAAIESAQYDIHRATLIDLNGKI